MAMTSAEPKVPLYRVHMPDGIEARLGQVLYSGAIAGGPNVQAFESGMSAYLGNPYLTSTGDVSTSLTLALSMAGVGPGDEVLASPMACLATNQPVLNLSARIRWCDIDPLTGGIDPSKLSQRIGPRTKAILVYHWAGYPVDLQAIYDVARRHELKVVEDAGESLGAEYGDRKIGNTGSDFTVFSFHAIRHMTTGEGAIITFADADQHERGRWLKRYGIHQPTFRNADGEINPQSDIPIAGYNSYMTHLAATIGLAQLESLPRIVQTHQENGQFFDHHLNGFDGVTLLAPPDGARPSYWVYTFLAKRRDDLLRHLASCQISASKVHWRNDRYTCFGESTERLPGVDRFQAECISIPCGWWVDPPLRQRIVDAIRAGW